MNNVELLKYRQSLPLDLKIELSKKRIREWYYHWDGQVYVAFSGGKDSTALLDLVRSEFPDVPAVFVDTGLEYTEIKEFVKTIDNVVWLKPKMSFKKVIDTYGYPIISKQVAMGLDRYRNTKHAIQRELRLYGGINPSSGKLQHRTIPKQWHFLVDAPFKVSDRCCDIMKKSPFKRYNKETGRVPFIGTMASDSTIRKQDYLKYGCNSFEKTVPKSLPLAFWLEEDIWDHLISMGIPYSKIYDMGETNTGCMNCGFGVHLEKGTNRFQRMKGHHPKEWKHCMEYLGLREVLEYIGVPYE